VAAHLGYEAGFGFEGSVDGGEGGGLVRGGDPVEGGVGEGGVELILEQQEVQLLQDADPQTRQAAVDSVTPDYWKAHLDQLFSIMTADGSIEVRRAAYIHFQAITQIKGDALDNFTAVQWWKVHRGEFVK
jgi:hypothetical protein